MKRLFCSIIFTLSIGAVYSQTCTSFIPGNTKVITTDSTISQYAWVCEGLKVTIEGDGKTYIIERNCEITINGNSNDILMRAQGECTINGDNNKLHVHKDVVMINNGNGNTINTCTVIAPDYSSAPQPGCAVTVGVKAAENVNRLFEVYPNPSNGQFTIRPQNYQQGQLQIVNTIGKVVYRSNIKGTEQILLSNSLQAGIYFLRFESENEVFTQRLILHRE